MIALDKQRWCRVVYVSGLHSRERITVGAKRDLSSAGRASALQAEGHRFEPYRSHYALHSLREYSANSVTPTALPGTGSVSASAYVALHSLREYRTFGEMAQLARASGSYPGG